jgi:PPE-SVP subfamily C-terminal region
MNYRGFLINADRDFAQGKGPFTGNGPGAQMLPEWFFSGFGNVGAPSTAATAAPVAAGLGQATSVGALSVPSGWASAAPAFRPVAYSLPITATEAAPGIALSSSGNLLSDMALAGMAGRAVGSTATLGHRERVGAPTRERGKPRPKSPDVAVTGIAVELRELATRAQALLAKLQDAGIFTDEEVTEQKRRFPGL